MIPQSRFSDLDRTLQARFLVTLPHKVLSAEAGITRQTVTALANGAWPVSAFRAFQFSAIQHDFRFLQILAERAGAILLPHRAELGAWSLMRLFTHLVLNFGDFLMLTEKITNNEVLTDEEMIALEEKGTQIKATVDAYLAKAREQRRHHLMQQEQPHKE